MTSGSIIHINLHKPNNKLVTLLEILSYATIMFATGMQLPVACNCLWFFMQLQWIFAPFLGVYTTMVQLWSPSSQPLDDFCDISSYICARGCGYRGQNASRSAEFRGSASQSEEHQVGGSREQEESQMHPRIWRHLRARFGDRWCSRTPM